MVVLHAATEADSSRSMLVECCAGARCRKPDCAGAFSPQKWLGRLRPHYFHPLLPSGQLAPSRVPSPERRSQVMNTSARRHLPHTANLGQGALKTAEAMRLSATIFSGGTSTILHHDHTRALLTPCVCVPHSLLASGCHRALLLHIPPSCLTTRTCLTACRSMQCALTQPAHSAAATTVTRRCCFAGMGAWRPQMV